MSVVPLPMSLPDLEQRLTGFLADEFARTGFDRGLVGVSGGLDSAVTLLLAARALGPAHVTALLLPYRTSAPDSVADARSVAALAGARVEEIDISPMVDAFSTAAGTADPLRVGNKMARERMTLLYDRALRDRGLVVGTSNKTELLLGYSTRWGDAACDLCPLGDLYKGQVLSLAEHLGVPRPILEKPPSAELWPGQTDEQELGLTYAVADQVLWWLVDQGGAPERAADELNLPADVVAKVVRRVTATQFKRELPRICKVQRRTVGVDFCAPPEWAT